jgi:ribosome-binding protein aMBF1 (putative translation factor)
MTCKECGEQVDELVSVKIDRRTVKVCEDCVAAIQENEEIAQQAEGVMQSMMEYRGRR